VTAPIEPTPGAPAAEPSPQTDPTGLAPAAPETEDVTSLPQWGQDLVAKLRAEAAKARTTAKQTAAEEARQQLTADVARALGLAGDDPVTPEKLTEQIAAAQDAAWRSGTELQVHRVAARLGADPEALLDSNAFIDSLDDLVDVDPRSAEFATQLETKVQAALEKSPNKYKAAGLASAPSGPRPDPSQGARGPAVPLRPTDLGSAIQMELAQRAAGRR